MCIRDRYVDLAPAQMRTGSDWYRGTADAIYQNIFHITDENPRYVCIFGGDHIYKMDVSQMLDFHKSNNSDLTISAIPIPIEEASEFGIIAVSYTHLRDNFRVAKIAKIITTAIANHMVKIVSRLNVKLCPDKLKLYIQ